MEGYCNSCGCLRELEYGLCPKCLAEFRVAERVRAKMAPREIELTLSGIVKAAAGMPTAMAEAFYNAAVIAILNGSAYGWPR